MAQRPLIELHYLPTLEYMALLVHQGGAVLEAQEHFQRRTFRNRTRILTDQGVLDLSLPLVKGNKGSVKQPIREVVWDPRAQGPRKHWRALTTAYAKAPFFDHYAPFFEPLFEQPPATLFDFSHELLTMCLKLLPLSPDLQFSKNFVSYTSPEAWDCRNQITPQKPYPQRSWYRPVPYYQVFGDTFVPNLSIIDLLFNAGPQSLDILRQSVEKEVS